MVRSGEDGTLCHSLVAGPAGPEFLTSASSPFLPHLENFPGYQYLGFFACLFMPVKEDNGSYKVVLAKINN